ncbi:MAG: WavE lipopolysaccharide synthesis family protein [Akkermansia sp.]
MQSKNEILENLSVVVQGPISDMSKGSLLSVRQYLPNCKIILSTWEGSDLDGLEYDELILSSDPQNDKDIHYPSNANRMIVSTKAGLDAVTTKYVLKMRTDFILTGTNFIDLFLLDAPEPQEYKILKKRVVCYVWKPQRGRLFHCGDFYFFGLTEDLCKIWDLPLYTNEQFFYQNNNKSVNPIYRVKNPNQFHVEQYIWINLLKNNGVPCDIKDYTDWSHEYKLMTEKSFMSNAIFASFVEFSTFTHKPNLQKYNYPVQSRGYQFNDWVKLCRQYLDSSYQPAYYPKTPSKLLKFAAIAFIKVPTRLFSNLFIHRKTRLKLRLAGEALIFKLFSRLSK